jgi:hypothetical protein
LQLAQNLGAFGTGAPGYCNVSALGGGAQRDRSADTGVASGHQNDFMM